MKLAECAVHGEENGRREDLREAARTDLELRGVENEEDADQLDADGNEVVPFQRLVQDQVRGGELIGILFILNSTAIWSSDMCSVTVRKPSRAK